MFVQNHPDICQYFALAPHFWGQKGADKDSPAAGWTTIFDSPGPNGAEGLAAHKEGKTGDQRAVRVGLRSGTVVIATRG